MDQLPSYISVFFGATVLATVAIFYKAARFSKTTLLLLTAWLLAQGLIARSGFYTVTTGLPPRFVLLLLLPPLLGIALLFLTRAGRGFIDRLDVRTLTLLHAVRIPVEITLFWLFLHKAVPQLMTFEGRNYDILSGLTAPLVFYFGFVKGRLSKRMLLLWNVVCGILLFNIVAIAILSAPLPFQKFAFDQPNIAVLYFPFVWLPCCVVPLVLLSHLAGIRQLLRPKTTSLIAQKVQETKTENPVASA